MKLWTEHCCEQTLVELIMRWEQIPGLFIVAAFMTKQMLVSPHNFYKVTCEKHS